MYHVNGPVAGGEVVFVHPFRYLDDCLSFRDDDWVADLPRTTITGAVGQQFNGGVTSALFLAGYVVVGATEEDVAADLEHVAGWFSDNTRWRPADSLGGTA